MTNYELKMRAFAIEMNRIEDKTLNRNYGLPIEIAVIRNSNRRGLDLKRWIQKEQNVKRYL